MSPNPFRLPHRTDTHRRLVKIYGLEYVKMFSPVEQYQVLIATYNDKPFSYKVVKPDGKDSYRYDYPYLVKVDNS